MTTCLRCQRSSDDGYQRVTIGLCPACAHAVAAVMKAARTPRDVDSLIAEVVRDH